MTYNVMVSSFVVGAFTAFTPSQANGVYIEAGSASAYQMVPRMITLPSGTIHDLDGSDDAMLIHPKVWNDFLFRQDTTAVHTQYGNLIALIGKQGTLTAKILTASTAVTKTATARLLPIPEDAQWSTPYQTNKPNWLMIRGIWQLKSNWT